MPNDFFDVFDRAIARHVSEEASAFVHAVFSLNDSREVESLLTDAGFEGVTTRRDARSVELPPAREFMWQYIYCTPLMAVLPQSGNAQTEVLERDVVDGWQPWISGEKLRIVQSALISMGRR
jgi:hypothetical protein